ncbi:hypothetical protein PC9H_007831 [Pleurotus ostreatus]|uniref:Uncharacterized protein n=1 Tax=Pleurotus ostreatus TaxID=5322 RepID=A0A8H6ZU75_PLEOS|nr:uncharacterized protein PC9H_007831 [Pleurotus ostreatus]KAF7428604.1 hypothetical protein PC9H_007831 [Pleurotus ostreatus]
MGAEHGGHTDVEEEAIPGRINDGEQEQALPHAREVRQGAAPNPNPLPVRADQPLFAELAIEHMEVRLLEDQLQQLERTRRATEEHRQAVREALEAQRLRVREQQQLEAYQKRMLAVEREQAKRESDRQDRERQERDRDRQERGWGCTIM